MEKIRLMQYENLIECFNENLVEPILGKGYYNMGMDVYTCDKFTTEDLKRKFDTLTENTKLYKRLAIASLSANVLLLVLLAML